MATWPAGLPQELRQEGYSEARKSGVAATEMDAGPDFTRRRYTAVPTEIRGTLALTKAQVATLDAFYFTTLNGGNDAFDWTHPRTGAAASLKFKKGEAPRYVIRSGVWIATLSLEIQP